MIFDSEFPLPPLPQSDAFSFIFRHGRRDYPRDRVLYRVDGTDETLTLGQLEQQSLVLARSLKAQYHIQPQDVVAIFAHDLIQYPIAYFGTVAAGATVALIPVQKQQNETDIAAHLQLVDAKLVLTDCKLLALTEAALAQYRAVPALTLDRDIEAIVSKTMCADLSPVFELTTTAQADEHIGFINRTSGSTGAMKSVLVSHAHFIATMQATHLTIPSTTDPNADVWLSPLSLGFFINAKLHMGLNILLGIPVVLMRDSSLESSNLSIIPRHAVTFLFVAPPLAARLAADCSGTDLRSVKWILSAGSPISDPVRAALSRRFAGLPLTMEWASAETMLLTIQTEDAASRAPGSSGTLVHGCQARVVHPETGAACGVREAGELYVRNKLARFRGYAGNARANAEAFTDDGWFRTGDYGWVDERSNVYISDRIKELIKVGEGYGSHVSAAELEEVLFGCEAVGSVVVVGCRDEAAQLDRPTAFVVPAAGADWDEAQGEIERFASERLTGLRCLSGGVRCIERIPVTGFKINRRALRAMADPLRLDANSKESAISWLQAYHAAGDALNPDVSVPQFYTPDCVMRFPGQPPLHGHDAIKGFFKKQFALLDRMTHSIGHVDVAPDRIYQEATIEYVVKGDPEAQAVRVEGLAVFGKKPGADRMSFFTVFLDPRPLLERKRVVAERVELNK